MTQKLNQGWDQLHAALPSIAWLLRHLQGKFVPYGDLSRGWPRSVTFYGLVGSHDPVVYVFPRRPHFKRASIPKLWKKPTITKFRHELTEDLVDFLYEGGCNGTNSLDWDTFMTSDRGELLYQLRKLADYYLGGH